MKCFKLELEATRKENKQGRQRGRVVRVPDLRSGGHGFKSRSDHLAGVVSWRTLVQLLGHACKYPTGLPPASWDF